MKLHFMHSVMVTIVWEVGLFMHSFVAYHTCLSAFIISLLFLCGYVSGSQA